MFQYFGVARKRFAIIDLEILSTALRVESSTGTLWQVHLAEDLGYTHRSVGQLWVQTGAPCFADDPTTYGYSKCRVTGLFTADVLYIGKTHQLDLARVKQIEFE